MNSHNYALLHSWKQTKSHWSIFSFGLTVWWGRLQGLLRTKHQEDNAGHTQEHVYPSKGFYLQLGTYWNLLRLNWHYRRWLSSSTSSGVFLTILLLRWLQIYKCSFRFPALICHLQYCGYGCVGWVYSEYSWEPSIYILKMPQEGHGYNWSKIRRVCPTCGHNGIKTVVLFEPIQSSSNSELNSQPHLHCSHLADIRDRPKDFISSISYNHKLLHILDSITCVYTFWR